MNTAYQSTQLELFKSFKPLELIFIKHRFTFVDLFAGIGGFRIPLEELGGKCLGYSEIDADAIKVYETNFLDSINTDEIRLGDISHVNKLPFEVDLLVGGVPCQPWSIAGKLKGFDDDRGQLWFDVIRVVKTNKPKGFIFENVKGIAEPRNQKSLDCIVSQLSKAGYEVKYKILNSYDFGVPQDRNRIFIVGIRTDLENPQRFEFPQPLETHPKLYKFIAGVQACEFQKKKFSPEALFNGKIPASRGRFQKDDELNDFFLFSDIRDGHTTIHSWDLIKTTKREKMICTVILKNRRKKKYGVKDGNPLSFYDLKELIPDLREVELQNLINKKILRWVEDKGYEFFNSKISSGINGISKIFLPHSDVIATLTATGTRDYIATVSLECQEPEQYKKTFIKRIYMKKRFRPLSARDYAKLQGFPDWFILSENDNIAKRQLGNAVSVPVVFHLAKSVLAVIYRNLKLYP